MKKLILILALMFCLIFSVNTLALEKVDTSGAGLTPARFQEKCRDIVNGANLPYYQLTFQTPVNAVASEGTLTSTGVAPSNGDTVTIDTKTYTFKTVLTPTEGEVLIGTAAVSLDNLKSAINYTGTPGTDYSCTAAHPTVTATTNTDTTQIIQAKTKGVAGNSIAFLKVAVTLSVDAATLGTTTAGVDGTVGGKGDAALDTTYLYICIDTSTVADNNWRRITLGSIY